MTSFESFIYGLVQGITEYLPVSSSAHLVLLPQFLGEKDPGLAFDVFLHIGTFLATMIYFFNDWVAILKNPFPKSDGTDVGKKATMSWIHIIVGSLPAAIVGFVLKHWIEDHTRAIWIQAATLSIFGVLLWLVDRNQKKTRAIRESTYKDLFLIGCAQACALVPGVSRSGSTITACRALGFAREDSMRISFLLSLPVTFGAILLECRHWREIAASVSGYEPLVIGFISSFVFGAFAIHFMMKWMKKVSFSVFAFYRVGIAMLILIFLGHS